MLLAEDFWLSWIDSNDLQGGIMTVIQGLLEGIIDGVWILVLPLLGMGGIVATLWLWLKRRDQTVKLPIDRDALLRLPGYGLQQQISDRQMDVIGYLLLAVLITTAPFAGVGAKALLARETPPYFILLAILLCLLSCCLRAWKNLQQLNRYRLGYVAELATAAELLRLQGMGYQVFHDIQADGFNIDHLVVGANGVFAIETKGRHKWLRDARQRGKNHEIVFRDGRLQFPSWYETEPLSQAERQACWVHQWLSKAVGTAIPVTPVLVFPGWYIKLQSRPPFPVISHKQLVTTLPRLGSLLFSQAQINALSYQIAQRCVQGSP
ncbi:nuclease-related domain-containing protein [Aeromonas bivalvium]|uniref:nuclease-related domain-containing protein n=2 Tax=Aeromonas bivalvium TaxID=440079 RepID=UPI00370A9AF8